MLWAEARRSGVGGGFMLMVGKSGPCCYSPAVGAPRRLAGVVLASWDGAQSVGQRRLRQQAAEIERLLDDAAVELSGPLAVSLCRSSGWSGAVGTRRRPRIYLEPVVRCLPRGNVLSARAVKASGAVSELVIGPAVACHWQRLAVNARVELHRSVDPARQWSQAIAEQLPPMGTRPELFEVALAFRVGPVTELGEPVEADDRWVVALAGRAARRTGR